MKLNARLPNLFPGTAGGRRSLSSDDLALNFSFVLHDSSSSLVVHKAVEAARRHSRARIRVEGTILDGDAGIVVDTWITVSIGLPENLAAALGKAGLPNNDVVCIDRQGSQLQPALFFREQAAISFAPRVTKTLGVAALILRPGGKSQQLIVRGPFDGVSGRKDALRALETIIQAHVDQWMPTVRLWPVPAEILFPDEIT